MSMYAKNWKRSGILTIATLVIAALVLNGLLWILPKRSLQKDITSENFYTLSDEICSFLANLEDEVTFYLIDGGGSDEKFEFFLELLAEQSDMLTLKKIDPEDRKDLLSNWGLSVQNLKSVGYCLIAESDRRSEIVDYSSMFYYAVTNSTLNSMGMHTLSVSEYLYYAQYFGQDAKYDQYLSYLVNESYRYFQGETVIAAMLEYVVADVIPVHYVLTGHGERAFASTALEEMYSYYGSSYEYLNIRSVKEIPEDASTLLILAPNTDYSASEVAMLKAYLRRGGQITVLTDEENLSMPNLMSLLASYGLSATKGSVGERVPVNNEDENGEESEAFEFSDSVTVTINTSHESLDTLDQISELPLPVITGGNEILMDESVDPSLILTPLLMTSENAYVGEETQVFGERALAVAAETSDGAHLLWFTGADSYMVSADSISESNDPKLSNNYCLYLVTNWTNLTYESQLKYPEAILYDAGYLQASNSDAIGFGLCMILLCPTAVIGGGAVILYQRKKRN